MPRTPHGLLIVYTGDGKGKTTAALGLMLRAWGQGLRVRMIQFLKHSHARFGEHKAARRIGLDILSTGDGFTWTSKDMDQTIARARAGWAQARDLIQRGAYDLLVLDEFTYPLHYGWVPLDDVLHTLAQRPPAMHVVITGRHAPPALLDAADLVTEMRAVKHPYARGLPAQPGIEF